MIVMVADFEVLVRSKFEALSDEQINELIRREEVTDNKPTKEQCTLALMVLVEMSRRTGYPLTELMFAAHKYEVAHVDG